MADEPNNEEIGGSGGFGLDKDVRLADKRAKAAEDAIPEPLDPPFPYRVVKFDPIFVQKWGL